MIPEKMQKELVKQHYKVVGNHSVVKLCHWLKKSLRGEGFCYKQKFYPDLIKSHRCLQISPSISCCNFCRYCWRTYPKSIVPGWDELKFSDWDEPKDIIKGAIEAQRLLLSGFKGWKGTNLKKWKQAQNPTNAAISLTGEPCLYPKLSELIEEFHKLNFITFLVTNGQIPERLENLVEPTQLYISLDAPDFETYKRIDRPRFPDFWTRLNKSLELMNSFSCKKVIRLTLVKGWNMLDPKCYAKLIEKANPDWIELKGYVHVGESQKRLPRESMPTHEEIKKFSRKISIETGYEYNDEQAISKVVLLRR
jgi:tRNA wybutosine-synthesizing protein 1